MSTNTLEKRVAYLEGELARLRELVEKSRTNSSTKDWLDQIAGSFENDPMYEEAMRHGRKWRESSGTKPRKSVKSKARRRQKV